MPSARDSENKVRSEELRIGEVLGWAGAAHAKPYPTFTHCCLMAHQAHVTPLRHNPRNR